MTTYSVGDVVRLKSGGPKMTVMNLPGSTNSSYLCAWFASESQRMVQHFPGDTLELAKSE